MDTNTQTFYRVSDTGACGQILANRIPTLTQAQHILELLKLDFPDAVLEIESYTCTLQ